MVRRRVTARKRVELPEQHFLFHFPAQVEGIKDP